MRATIILLLLLAACSAEVTQEETIIPAITPHIDAGILSEEKPHLEQTLIFVLTDKELAVRTSMREGETLTLPTTPQVTITVHNVHKEHARITINEETQTIQKGEAASFLEGRIKLFAAELHP